MSASLAIGDFSRATHLSVKTLRHYHQVGLLEPADVDPGTGHRRYAVEQIPTAQVIKRFRSLDMPLDEIQAVLSAPDPEGRNQLIAAHLHRLEQSLARTQEATASLRTLLQQPDTTIGIEHRRVDQVSAVAVSEVIDAGDALSWLRGALGELYAALAAQSLPASGPGGGVFTNELFSEERGLATIFVPYPGGFRPMGRALPTTIPAVELATTVHVGSHQSIDRAYGTLARYVAEQALAVEGPIREYYLIGQHETDDESQWHTEVGWPIFRTG